MQWEKKVYVVGMLSGVMVVLLYSLCLLMLSTEKSDRMKQLFDLFAGVGAVLPVCGVLVFIYSATKFIIT